MQLSPHFSLEEFTRSQEAIRRRIDNTPDDGAIKNMQALCVHILEPLKEKLNGIPIIISSGFRCKELNRVIKGARNSQHITGNAADIYAQGYSAEELFQFIKRHFAEYDQLIQEFDNWVHISWAGFNNRNECLRATKQEGKTIYTAV